MEIKISNSGKGPLINFKDEKFSIRYKGNLWKNLDREFKKFFLDNYVFLKSVHLPLFLRDTEIKFNTNEPLLKDFFLKMQYMDIPTFSDSIRTSTSELFELFNEVKFYFKPGRPLNPHLDLSFDKDSAIVSMSFGKESLLTYAILKELGFKTHPVWVSENGFPLENNSKSRLCNIFKRKFGEKIDRIENNTMLLHKFEHYKIKALTEYSLSHTMTEYGFLFLPYLLKYNSKNLFFGNEQSCNSSYINKEGYVAYAIFDQSVQWMKEMNIAFNSIFKNKINIGSLVEPLHEISILKILHQRYPQIGKYQSSCFPDMTEKNKRKRWCCRCSKCARIFIMFKALGINPKKMGFHENMLQKQYSDFFPIFNGHKFDNSYDSTGLSKDEQLFAFLLAFKNRSRGYLIDKFKEKYLKEVSSREDEFHKTFFRTHSFETVPPLIKMQLESIFKESLSD